MLENQGNFPAPRGSSKKEQSMIMTKTLLLSSAVAIALAGSLNAQIKTPAPSPYSEVKQTVGITEFTIKYSRPGMKDRAIYGGLVPYGEVWRTGANATTKIAFDTEIDFGGTIVPAGEYVLFTIPGEAEWTVIIYGDTEIANAGLYDQSKDVARVMVAPAVLNERAENFTIGFDFLRDDSANLNMDWANTRVSVPVKLNTAALSMATIDAAIGNMESWTARDYASAADAYAANGKDLATATEWMGKAASMNESAFWWQHRYAKMLADQGNKEAAIAAAEKSLATAKAAPGGDSGYIKLNEDLLATLK